MYLTKVYVFFVSFLSLFQFLLSVSPAFFEGLSHSFLCYCLLLLLSSLLYFAGLLHFPYSIFLHHFTPISFYFFFRLLAEYPLLSSSPLFSFYGLDFLSFTAFFPAWLLCNPLALPSVPFSRAQPPLPSSTSFLIFTFLTSQAFPSLLPLVFYNFSLFSGLAICYISACVYFFPFLCCCSFWELVCILSALQILLLICSLLLVTFPSLFPLPSSFISHPFCPSF